MFTFLITDIEASTRLWDSDPVGMSQAVAAHDRVVKRSITTAGGRVFATTGDGFAAVFPSPDHAIRAAIYVQIILTDGNLWPHLKVRTGIHYGPAEERDGNFFGPTVNHCGRLTEVGWGGQILMSEDASLAVRGCVETIDLGHHLLRDLSKPMRILQVAHPKIRDAFPPITNVRFAAASGATA
jgi:class 3 adenylate cyclase